MYGYVRLANDAEIVQVIWHAVRCRVEMAAGISVGFVILPLRGRRIYMSVSYLGREESNHLLGMVRRRTGFGLVAA